MIPTVGSSEPPLKNLYVYENGQLINYTVHWQIINTMVDRTPETGDSIRRVFFMMFLRLGGVLVLVLLAKKKVQQIQA